VTKVKRPRCKLLGADSNIFNLIGLAVRTLKQAGKREDAIQMQERCWAAESYSEALFIIGEYVEIC